MTDLEERIKNQKFSKAYLSGERIFGVKFRHNSQVSFLSDDDKKIQGWIVAVGPIEPEPIYTVERSDGEGDEEILESKIELIFDPHEHAQISTINPR